MAAVTMTGRSSSLSMWGVESDLRFNFVFGNTSDSSDSSNSTSGGAELNSEIANIDSEERSEVRVHAVQDHQK